MLTHKAYEFYAMTNRMVRTQVVKMGLTDLSDSRCVSVVLIKASLVLLSCIRDSFLLIKIWCDRSWSWREILKYTEWRFSYCSLGLVFEMHAIVYACINLALHRYNLKACVPQRSQQNVVDFPWPLHQFACTKRKVLYPEEGSIAETSV